jgi:hypothetical protein
VSDIKIEFQISVDFPNAKADPLTLCKTERWPYCPRIGEKYLPGKNFLPHEILDVIHPSRTHQDSVMQESVVVILQACSAGIVKSLMENEKWVVL